MLKYFRTLKRCLLRTQFLLTWGISSDCWWHLNSQWLSLKSSLMSYCYWDIQIGKIIREMKSVLSWYHVELGHIPFLKHTFYFSKGKIACLIAWCHLKISYWFLWIPDCRSLSMYTVQVTSYSTLICLNSSGPQTTHRLHLMLHTINQDPYLLYWFLILSLFDPKTNLSSCLVAFSNFHLFANLDIS